MRRCRNCRRHLFDETSLCPFCGTADRVVHWAPVLGVMLGLAVAGCGDSAAEVDASGSGTHADTSAGTTAPTTTGSTDDAQTTVVDMTGTTLDPDTGSTASTGSGDATTTMDASTDETTGTGTTGDGGIDDTTSTTDDSMDTAMPPYAGAYPDPEDEADPGPESTTGVEAP